MSACTGSALQYQDEEFCLDVCGALFGEPNLALGSFLDGTRTLNSLACRFVAIGDDAVVDQTPEALVCAGAGPAGAYGGGAFACGDGLCEAYCTLMNATCPEQFASDHENLAACETACSDLGGNAETFAWSGNPSGDTFSCRLNQVMLAVTEEPNRLAHCDQAKLASIGCD
jgi:hypothetical protein